MRRILPTIVAIPPLLLGACRTVELQETADRGGLRSEGWFQVGKAPPTYFPKGIPADHPVGVWDGVWVRAGDGPAGSRFFIPERGAGGRSKEALVAEARALMPPEARREYERGVRRSRTREGAQEAVEASLTVAGGILYMAAAVGAGLGGGGGYYCP